VIAAAPIALALTLINVSLFGYKPPHEKYKDRNPAVVVHETAEQAHAAAMAEAKALNGRIYKTSGTPSMLPLIDGQVFVVGQPKAYDQLCEGDIANYNAKWAGGTVLHRLVAKDKEGWIPSGDNNARSEPNEKVKPDNYCDVVVKIHTYKGAEKTRVKK
jgi:hypothetical protein